MTRRTIIVVFLGIDGSGKTTLSHYLYNELKKRKLKVAYLWWLEGENLIPKRILRKFGKFYNINSPTKTNPNRQVKRKNINITAKLFHIIYPRLVFLNYILFGIVKVWIPKITNTNDIMIFDRYIYDVVLAISKEFNYSFPKMIRLLKIYSKLLPTPDLIFIVDVPPKVAYYRKREELHTLENARKIWENYQELYLILSTLSRGKIIKVDNSQSLEIAKSKVLKAVLEMEGP